MSRGSTNRLLQSLNLKSRQAVLARSKLVDLAVRQTLSEAGGIPKSAFFPLSGFASEVVQMADGEFVEIGLVGNEGVTGSYYLLGPSSALHHCFVQTRGTAYEIPFRDLEDLCRLRHNLYRLLGPFLACTHVAWISRVEPS